MPRSPAVKTRNKGVCPAVEQEADSPDTYTKSVLRPEIILKSSVKVEVPKFSKAVLHELYVKKGLNQRQIAEQFASSKTAVQKALKRFGIPCRMSGKGFIGVNANNIAYGKMIVDGEIREHPEEQKNVSLIVSSYQKGEGLSAIARTLNKKGVPTKKSGKIWRAENIRQILIREGIYKKRGEV